ncbi:MAG: hypothetical protein WA659_01080 [Candidatus Aquirickettsiella sp.]
MPKNALATVNLSRDQDQLIKDEPESRVKIVGEQHEFEVKLALDTNGRAVFFVPSPLTPLYINPEAVQFNEQSNLYELKPDHRDAIPEGLIPEKKLKNPTQLSTVLARVLSLWELKQNPVIIFYVQDRTYDEGRKKVDDSHLKAYLNKDEHPYCKLVKITKAEYDAFKAKNLSEAIYSFHDKDGALIQVCIYATQINKPELTSNWLILTGQDAQPIIKNANELLVNHGEEPIPPLETHAQVAGKSSLFTPLPANQATVTSPTTDTCRLSTTTSSI